MPNDQQRRSGAFASCLTLLAIAVGLALLGNLIMRVINREPVIQPLQGCTVVVDDHSSFIDLEQAGNVAIISAAAIGEGLPARATTLGIVTAWQESSLRNLDYGDRDSLGLFQQRPSQGWGTVEQIMDPWYSSRKFYSELVRLVPGWETGDINDVAQAVQRSGFPEAYRKHEHNGRVWASALNGYSPHSVTCVVRDGSTMNSEPILYLLQQAYRDALSIRQEENVLVIEHSSAEVRWSVAQLAMLVPETGLQSVRVDDWAWSVNGEWTQVAPSDNVVRLEFRA